MEVKVLYFSFIRQRLQRGEDVFSLPAGSRVPQLIEAIIARHPVLRELRGRFGLALNEEMLHPSAQVDQALAAGDVVALIPPVSGGSGYRLLSAEPLLMDPLIAAVVDAGQGALVTFVGLVRGDHQGQPVVRLEYEAYESMVVKTLGQIIGRCEAIGPRVRVAISHRTGAVAVGQPAVMIAAAAPHRPAAFEACRLAIELIKQDVPIWKKEVGLDGEEWVAERP